MLLWSGSSNGIRGSRSGRRSRSSSVGRGGRDGRDGSRGRSGGGSVGGSGYRLDRPHGHLLGGVDQDQAKLVQHLGEGERARERRRN